MNARVGPPNVATQLARLGWEARRVMSDELEGLALRPPQFGLILVIAKTPASSQQWLAERLHIDRANLVELLDDLERRGLVERVADPADRRRHSIRITEDGKSAARQALKAVRVADEKLLADLTPEERTQLAELLAKVAARVWAEP